MSRLRLTCFVLAAVVGGAGAAQARELTYSDILGSWCGDTSKYEFTRQALTVTWFGSADRRVLPVQAWEFSETSVNVKWKPSGNTIFSDFKAGTMAQMPNTTKDMGPRREFRRCQ